MSDNANPITVEQVIRMQTPIRNNKFLCEECKNWERGTVGCKKNYFISVVGAYIGACWGFEELKEEKP